MVGAVYLDCCGVYGDFQGLFIRFYRFITGVLCVVLAAKGNLMSYVFGMYNTVGYAYLAYINGLFGEVMLNLLFFVPMNVIGFFMWKSHRQDGKLIMRQMELKGLLLVGTVCVLGCLLGFGLSFIRDRTRLTSTLLRRCCPLWPPFNGPQIQGTMAGLYCVEFVYGAVVGDSIAGGRRHADDRHVERVFG